MSRFLSQKPLKSNAKLQKAWEKKNENQELRPPKSGYYKDRPKMEFLSVIKHGNHRLQLISKGQAKMYINTPGFKQRIEPEGKMSVSRVNTPIGAEYSLTFAGPEEWEYIKSVFMAFAFMAGKWN